MRTGPVVTTAALFTLSPWLSVLAPGLASSSLEGQDPPTPPPSAAVDASAPADSLSVGQRLRVRTFDGAIHDGRLMDLTPAGLDLRSMGLPVAIPRASIEQVEVHRGTVSGSRKGAIWVGLTMGVLGGVVFRDFCVDLGSCTSEAGAALFGFAIGGTSGAMLGAIGGLAFRSDRWEAIPYGRESN